MKADADMGPGSQSMRNHSTNGRPIHLVSAILRVVGKLGGMVTHQPLDSSSLDSKCPSFNLPTTSHKLELQFRL